MNSIHALILGIVEGITEFLPISSTGHMILASTLLHLKDTEFLKNFMIIIQLGAILAMVVYYWRTITKDGEIWKRLILAFIPTGVIGYALFHFIKKYLIGNEMVTLWSLLIGGILLIVFELVYKEKEHHVDDLKKIPYKSAVIIGVVQSLAVIPGVSRSAATILGGLALGIKRRAAVEFSFLLAIPTMLAATGFDVLKMHTSFSGNDVVLLFIGLITAFGVAYLVIKYFLLYIKKNTFIPFGMYRIVIAIIFWLFIIR